MYKELKIQSNESIFFSTTDSLEYVMPLKEVVCFSIPVAEERVNHGGFYWNCSK
jgi:hypothetical protein